MIRRFRRSLFQLFPMRRRGIEVRIEGRVPEVDRKTRADVRREIFGKLSARMEKLEISNGLEVL
jgi:hypothetical protein